MRTRILPKPEPQDRPCEGPRRLGSPKLFIREVLGHAEVRYLSSIVVVDKYILFDRKEKRAADERATLCGETEKR